jgi:hypothetical protein
MFYFLSSPIAVLLLLLSSEDGIIIFPAARRSRRHNQFEKNFESEYLQGYCNLNKKRVEGKKD